MNRAARWAKKRLQKLVALQEECFQLLKLKSLVQVELLSLMHQDPLQPALVILHQKEHPSQEALRAEDTEVNLNNLIG